MNPSFGEVIRCLNHLFFRFSAARITNQERPLHLSETFNDGLGVDGIVGNHGGKIRSLLQRRMLFFGNSRDEGRKFPFSRLKGLGLRIENAS